jgi:hypothetical protein
MPAAWALEMAVKVLADLRRRLDPLAPQDVASKRPAAAQYPLRIAACSFPRALGRAEAGR